MADSDTEVIAWHMGAPVVHESSIADIMNALAFGRDDSSSWLSIRDKLISRGCKTVGILEEGWSHEELISLIRPLKVKKHPRVYIAGIAAAIERDILKSDQKVKMEGGGGADGQGGQWYAHCTKQKAPIEFGVSKYKPDGRIFAMLPKKGCQDHLSVDEEFLLVDLLWMDAHVNPESTMGDYLPSGMPFRLAAICRQLVPPFKPTKKGEERDPKKIISLRHQNARDAKEPLSGSYTDTPISECIA